jgi:alkanesulfonate monooxygenase SsuD/methylene tetrahydromethanopterin reductase-like flavin-dependent oxidoreductase (luciferase family)
VQRPHPNLILGGAAGPVASKLAARWAGEYNTTSAAPEDVRERRQRLSEACEAVGRDPSTLTFSVMTACIVGRDHNEVLERVGRVLDQTGQGGSAEAMVADPPRHWILGTVDQVAERLEAYQEAGLDRIMLQHLAHDDLDMVALIGDALVPRLA